MYINKKIFTAIITFIICLSATVMAVAQDYYIPYKQGNLFGLVNQHDEIKLNAKYSVLNVLDDSGSWFVGYYKHENMEKLDFIYNDKVIIKDSDYVKFEIEDNYILVFKAESYNAVNIYNLKGERLLTDDAESVYTIPNYKERNTINYLVWVDGLDGKTSAYTFNGKQGKFTSTLFKNKYITEGEFYNLLSNPSSKFTMREDADKYTKFIIYSSKNGFIISYKLDVEIPSLEEEYSSSGYGEIMIGRPAALNFIDDKDKADTTTLKKLRVIYPNKYNKKQIVSIQFNEHYNKDQSHRIFSKGKFKGVESKINGQTLIPAVYDEIIFLDSRQFTCILKKDNKYGFAYYLEKDKKQAVVEPVFELLPFPIIKSYGKDKMILIRLFDKEGKFYCYANEKGELFLKQ